MAKPSPYSNTDAAETAAVNTLMNLLDPKQVKSDIRIRDKYPNSDGSIELVDLDNRPIGKIEVQVRKITDGSKSYRCKDSIIGYSEKSILPFILICVDVKFHRAYWRQITPNMREYKQDQCTFTINFNEISDCIDSDRIYIQKWTEIILDYQRRIKDDHKLIEENINKPAITNIDSNDIRLLQLYIDNVNNLLDNDFLAIKKKLFPNVWKLGVGIFDSKKDWISFQIYKIPYGESEPLVCHLESKSPPLSSDYPNAISLYGTTRDNFIDPEISAKNYVLDCVKYAVEKRLLNVQGKLTSLDILFSFIDRYYKILSLQPEKDEIEVDELNYAMNKRMLGICASYAMLTGRPGNYFVSVDLDRVDDYIRAKTINPITPNNKTMNLSIRSHYFSIEVVFDSLRNILNTKEKTIKRPFIPRNFSITKNNNFIWSGYSAEDEIHNIKLMLENAIPEYSEFIQKNRLSLPESKYIDNFTTILMEYEPSFILNGFAPRLHEIYIRDSSKKLPKFIVSIVADKKRSIDISTFPQVRYQGVNYEATTIYDSSAEFLFSETPMLNLQYLMLSRDLSDYFDTLISI